MYEYRCKLDRVVDGDTVDVDIDLGFGVWLRKQRIRLFGINAPESRTRDLEEKKKGLAAKQFVVDFLDDEYLILKTETYDATGKYGRILGSIFRTTDYADKSVNEYLVEKGHAVPYFGGKR
tara:strand:+ start:1149 stop:1511 length:363 start_codon:yes stop_codon:yes gene_type:complete